MAIEEIFGSRLRAKLLAWFSVHPDESFFTRQLASLLQEYPGNISRELATLERAGVVLRQSRGLQKYYRLDPDCPFSNELRGIFVKTLGLATPLRQALEPIKSRLSFAFVYGSFARGEQRANSDIDVMVVGTAGVRPVASALAKVQRDLGREVNATVYSPGEFKQRAKAGDHFITAVLQEPRVFLWGGEDDVQAMAH
jgi:predicted nucleotidyltransferase